MSNELFAAVDEAWEAGQQWARAAAVYNRYKEGAKAKLARIKNEVLKTEKPPTGRKTWSADALDQAAYGCDEWHTFIQEMNEAYEYMLLTRNQYDSANNKFEAIRSVMATERIIGKAG